MAPLPGTHLDGLRYATLVKSPGPTKACNMLLLGRLEHLGDSTLFQQSI